MQIAPETPPGRALPPADRMYRALVERDPEYVGVFFACVRTTGIFCLPTCRARKPRAENVEFVATAAEAMRAGFRACKVCAPTEPPDQAPAWAAELIARVEAAPARRITDADLRASGLDPVAVRRWFLRRHGVTFQGWQRAGRVGAALGELRRGASAEDAAHGGGFGAPSSLRDACRRLFGAPPASAAGSELLVARWLESPLGPLIAVASDAGLVLLEFTDRRMLETQVATLRRRFARPGGADACIVPGSNAHLERVERELARYFAGALTEFEVALDVRGSPFQLRVWEGLRAIGYGETRSYAELAAAIGRPGAARAVGRANGENRLAIVIPCHRVIGADGTPTGYGGGVWRKVRMLELERETRAAKP